MQQCIKRTFERFLILELVVACHYLDYTQAFRVFGEGGVNMNIQNNKEEDPRNAKERLITYVGKVKSEEKDGKVPVGGASKNFLEGDRIIGDLESVNQKHENFGSPTQL